MNDRTLHEILEAAEKRVLPPSRHAGQMKANNMVIISIGEDRMIKITVDGRRVLHIKMHEDCKLVAMTPQPDHAVAVKDHWDFDT
jgi:hypothetical protein